MRNTDLAIETGRSAMNILAIPTIGTCLHVAALHGDCFGLIV
jgi:hypothetical protein